MFCSLLQEHLGHGYPNAFVQGALQHADLAQDVRLSIHKRIRQMYHIPSPLEVSPPPDSQRILTADLGIVDDSYYQIDSRRPKNPGG